MAILDYIRLAVGALLIIVGAGIFVIQLIGVFKLKDVLSRMHAAAMGDTIGIASTLLGVIVLTGLNFTSLKVALIIVFLWMASPVSSHLISRLEVTTNENLEEICEVPEEKWEDEIC
ncbi:MAG: monovalent cation/H(+) antiporter subunit G [Oscillospiraceae bacterium]|nr:monovalent cation/H(+) antiporter subunit G [Oscillospiraceae bacterium]